MKKITVFSLIAILTLVSCASSKKVQQSVTASADSVIAVTTTDHADLVSEYHLDSLSLADILATSTTSDLDILTLTTETITTAPDGTTTTSRTILSSDRSRLATSALDSHSSLSTSTQSTTSLTTDSQSTTNKSFSSSSSSTTITTTPTTSRLSRLLTALSRVLYLALIVYATFRLASYIQSRQDTSA